MKAMLALTLTVTIAPLASPQTKQATTGAATITTHDRAEIELLSARYSLALGSCDAKTWPALFVAPDGFFAAGPRGKVQGPHRLGEMIRSYDCNYTNGVAPPHAPAVLVPYKIVIEPSRGGATGTAYYNGGHYEDVYVKTPQGWRFGSRTVVTNREQAAKLTAADFDAIQLLAASHGGPYSDLYEPIPGGTRFKSAGVAIEVRPDGIAGKAYLPNNGGHYEDTYEKTPSGWRFKSRVHVPAEKESDSATRASTPPSGSAR
jgi:SnoaL-like domain